MLIIGSVLLFLILLIGVLVYLCVSSRPNSSATPEEKPEEQETLPQKEPGSWLPADDPNVPRDYSSQRLDEPFTLKLSRGLTLQTLPPGEVTLAEGELISGTLSIWHDKDDSIEQWQRDHSDGMEAFPGAAATLRVKATFRKDNQTYTYQGYIACYNLHFDEGESASSTSKVDWPQQPSVQQMVDSRDDVTIKIDDVDHTVKEKYMAACCTLAVEDNVLKVRNCFHDIYNTGEVRAVYYDRPIESILFLKSPQIYMEDGEIEDMLLHDGEDAKLTME